MSIKGELSKARRSIDRLWKSVYGRQVSAAESERMREAARSTAEQARHSAAILELVRKDPWLWYAGELLFSPPSEDRTYFLGLFLKHETAHDVGPFIVSLLEAARDGADLFDILERLCDVLDAALDAELAARDLRV